MSQPRRACHFTPRLSVSEELVLFTRKRIAFVTSLSLSSQCRDVRTREVGIQEIHHKVKPYEVSQG